MIGHKFRYVRHLPIRDGGCCDDYGPTSGITRCGDAKNSACNCWYTLHSSRHCAERLRGALPMYLGWSIVEVASGGGVDSIKHNGCNDNNRDDHHHDH